jgi:hypothetical protein
VIASVFWTALSVTTLTGMAVGILALLLSNTLGDRVQTILLCVVLLVLGLTWLVSSAAFLATDVFGWVVGRDRDQRRSRRCGVCISLARIPRAVASSRPAIRGQGRRVRHRSSMSPERFRFDVDR